MAVIYAFIGIVLFLLLDKTDKGVQGNILASIPETLFLSIPARLSATISGRP